MNRISFKQGAATLWLLLLFTSAQGQTPASNSPINAKMRQADQRLNAPITFSADRIYLGELLEALSAKTGVTLSMDNADSFSGILVACDLKQKPLADVMNSVWSLVGSKSGLWEWRADTGQTPRRYSFQPTLNARNLAERLHQAMQARFEAQTELLTRLALMSPAERQAHAEDLRPLLRLRGEDFERDRKVILDNVGFWEGMRLFGTLLSADQRKRVLNGEKIDIPLDSLPEDQRQSVLAVEEGQSAQQRQWQLQSGAPIHERPQEPTEAVTFGGAGQRNYWMVTVGFTSKRRSSAGGAFGLNTDPLAPDVFADWILPGDVRKLEVETRVINRLPAFKPEEVWSSVPVLDHNIAAAATLEDASFMAVVPEHPTEGETPMITAGKTSGEYFSAMWNGKMLMHKWRDGILLAHYPKWFFGDEALYPYGLVKRLRVSLRKQDGWLSPKDLAEPVTTLNDAQMGHLYEEFPFAGPSNVRLPSRIALCAFYQRYPKALSEQGIQIDLKMRAFFQDPDLWPKSLSPVGEDATAIRILDNVERLDIGKVHTYILQIMTPTQKWKDLTAFRINHIAPKAQP